MHTPHQADNTFPPFVAACGRCQGEPFAIEPNGELCIAHAREVMAAQGQSFGARSTSAHSVTTADLYAASFRSLGGMRIGA